MPKHTINFPVGDGFPGETDSRNALGVELISDGENVSAAVVNRPLDVLRRRTEVLRTEVEGLKYVSDADRVLLVDCVSPLTVTRHSDTPETLSFSIEAGSVFTIFTALGPGASRKPAYVDVSGLSTDGITATATYLRIETTPALLSYGGATDTVTTTGANNYSVELIETDEGTAITAAFDASYPRRKLQITCPTETTVTELAGALNQKIVTDSWPFTVGVYSANGVVNGDVPLKFPDTEVYFRGGAEQEAHVISATGLSSFFSAAENRLRDGDTLGVWYDTVNATNGVSGRQNSVLDVPGAVTSVDNNLSNLRRWPERIPYAIPVCTRIGDFLVFLDGTRVKADSTYSLGESLTRDGGAIHGELTVEGDTTFEKSLLVRESARIEGVDGASVTFTVAAPPNATANLSEWYADDTLVAAIENDGDLRAKALDTVTATQDLALGTKSVTPRVLLGRTNQQTTVQGTLVVAEGGEVHSKASTTVALTVTGTADQTQDMTRWGREGRVDALVAFNGAVFTPSVDTVEGATDQNFKIATENAESVTIGRTGAEVTVPDKLYVELSAVVAELKVGDEEEPAAQIDSLGNITGKWAQFDRVTVKSDGNVRALDVLGSLEATSEPTAQFTGRAAERDVLAVVGAGGQTGALQTWSADGASEPHVQVSASGKVVANKHVEVSAPSDATSAALAVTTNNNGQAALTLKGVANQTAPLQGWLASDGTVMSAAYADGLFAGSALDAMVGGLAVGTVSATGVTIAKAETTTTVKGPLSVEGSVTLGELAITGAQGRLPFKVVANGAVNIQEWWNGGNMLAAINQNGDLNVTHIYNSLNADAVRIDDALAVSNAATFDGALTVSGTTTLNGTYTNVNSRLNVTTPARDEVPLDVYGAADQSEPIQRWFRGGTLTTYIKSDGTLDTPKLWTNVIDGPGTAGVTIDDPLVVTGGVDIKPTTNYVALDVTAGRNTAGTIARPQQWRNPDGQVVAYVESDGDFNTKSVTVTTDIETPTLWVNTIDSRGAGVTVNDPLTVSGALTATTASITTVNATTLNATTLNAATLENPSGPTVSVTDSLNVTENVTLAKDLSVGDDLTVGGKLTVSGAADVGAAADNIVPLEVLGNTTQSVDLQRWLKGSLTVASIDNTGALVTPNVWTNAVESQGTLSIGAQPNTDVVVIGKSGGMVTVNGALIQTRTRIAKSTVIDVEYTDSGEGSNTVVKEVSLPVEAGDLLRIEVIPNSGNASPIPAEAAAVFTVGSGSTAAAIIALRLTVAGVITEALRIYEEDRESDSLPVIIHQVSPFYSGLATAQLVRIAGPFKLNNWRVVMTIL